MDGEITLYFMVEIYNQAGQ